MKFHDYWDPKKTKAVGFFLISQVDQSAYEQRLFASLKLFLKANEKQKMEEINSLSFETYLTFYATEF